MMVALNNVFNIRASKKYVWFGQIGSRKGFCVFSTRFFAVRSFYKILLAYEKRRIVRLKDIIYTFAPPTENDSEAYYNFVSLGVASLGFFDEIDGKTPVSSCLGLSVPNRGCEYWYHVARLMAAFETNTRDLDKEMCFSVLRGLSSKK